jgi:HK97 family phage prohead protease
MSDDLSVRQCERTYLLEDMTLRSDGSGRVVEAYAAVFKKPTEIRDQDGHYNEDLDPSSFNRTISHKGTNFGVLFNHARTVDGGPNPVASMPIAVPLEVKSDEYGVFTASRYLNNPLADWTLDAIKQGAIKAQSFSGKFLRSAKSYPQGRSNGLPLITRQEVNMREYGPAVFAAYADAAILGTRSADLFVRALLATAPEKRVEWLQQFEMGTALQDSALPLIGTPPGLAGSQTADTQTHSARSQQIRERIQAFREKTKS